ncbi:alkaline phosphatase PhoX [Microbispora bryophytorum]|uniref:alkaline phosphatase PhoX n=1 Tax=Microbispora bryophytorum TaxID=1460882 RepID=UPI0033C95F79
MQGISIRSAALSALPGALWRSTFARPNGGYEPSGGSESYGQGDPDGPFPADVLGALPQGFAGRIVARSGERAGGVAWHAAPDGGGCFPDGDGWIYVSNCALPLLGGVTALRFAPDGALRSGYRILSGADRCGAGVATPWHTWVSGERTPYGRVFECDPYGLRAPMPRLAMGLFAHGGVACDPDRGVVYLTEGEADGCLYRFRPDDWGDLTTGVLEVMAGDPGEESVAWERVPIPALRDHVPLREQVKGARKFAGGGDCRYSGGLVCFVTEGDGRVWAYDAARERLTVLHRTAGGADGGPASGAGGDAAGDACGGPGGGADGEITLVAGDRTVPFLRVTGGWTVAGSSMSPAGDRLYFSCRPPRDARPVPAAVTVEVRGPFHDLVRA